MARGIYMQLAWMIGNMLGRMSAHEISLARLSQLGDRFMSGLENGRDNACRDAQGRIRYGIDSERRG